MIKRLSVVEERVNKGKRDVAYPKLDSFKYQDVSDFESVEDFMEYSNRYHRNSAYNEQALRERIMELEEAVRKLASDVSANAAGVRFDKLYGNR